MDYCLYHDESKEAGFWHGMLLVPLARRQELLDYLEQARTYTGYSAPIGIKRVKKDGKIRSCAEAWAQIGIASLISSHRGRRHEVFLGRRVNGHREYDIFDSTIGAKFVLFREVDGHALLDGHVDHASKVETTFRMGLKGGLHYLGSEAEPIRIRRLHFDGWEHNLRHPDTDRIVGRMSKLRDYCSVDYEYDDRSSNHNKKGESQAYDDCQLLQLTDILIGSFRSALGVQTQAIHARLADAARSIIDRVVAGPARMRHSRWQNGIYLRQCRIKDGGWVFEPIEVSKSGVVQLGMFE